MIDSYRNILIEFEFGKDTNYYKRVKVASDKLIHYSRKLSFE